jgi:hypothetical protein
MTSTEPEPPAQDGAGTEDPLKDGIDEDYFTDLESTPETAEPFKVKDKDHPDTVRRALALPILWFLLITYALTIGAFLASRFIPHDPAFFGPQDLTAAIAGISGLQGLAAADVGFYFGGKQEENKR